MNYRISKVIAVVGLSVSVALLLGSCMPLAGQDITVDDTYSEVVSSTTDSFLSSAQSEQAPISSTTQSSAPDRFEQVWFPDGVGNQVIVDTDADVGEMDDPEDPMGPLPEIDDEPEAPQDTIVIPLPPTSSSGGSSSAGGSSAGGSSAGGSSTGGSSAGGSSAGGSSAGSSSNTVASTTTSVNTSSAVSSATPSSPSSSISSMISSIISSAVSSLIPSSPVSSLLPFNPPNTGWYDYNGNRYLYQGGKPVSGYQSVNGLGYYFAADGKLSSKFGIDVSKYQSGGTVGGVAQPIDWRRVKAAGTEFAIIRVGYRGYGSAGNLAKDPKFLENITNATAVGIDCGIYFFTQATTEAEAVVEARTAVQWLEESGKKITYPIFFDTELSSEGSGNGRADKLTVAARTATAKAFCDEIKRLGYYPAIYASTDWFVNHLDMSKLTDYDVWTAHYRTNITQGPGYTKNMGIWQYTSKGKIDGIAENVDCNIGLIDYAQVIRQNGYNKLTAQTVSSVAASNQGQTASQ